jgi:uncharacterized protein YdeI (YjbR/CyaY-like superfamily)
MKIARNADAYFREAPKWREELLALRRILLAQGLVEEIKWGSPVYTTNGANVVGLAGFKTYFGLWFFQGALLKDAGKVLVNAQEGRTKAQRQWRMSSMTEIKPALVAKYAKQAMGLAHRGEAVVKSPPQKLKMPADLGEALGKSKKAAAAFARLTPGRQREYADYVSEAKLSATREKRIAKILPMIVAGVGLNDKYR